MSEGLTPGWYTGPDNIKRYWDGKQWLTPSGDAPAQEQTTEESAEGLAEPVLVPTEPEMVPEVAGRKRKRWPIVAAVAGVVAIGGGGVAYVLLSSPSASQVAAMCTDDVKSYLRSPNTAEFDEVEVASVRERLDYVVALAFIDLLADSDTVDGLGPSDVLTMLEADQAEQSPEDKATLDEWGANEGGEMRFVTGYVDSQNGFGATVHAEFTCLYDGDTVETLSIGDTVQNADSVHEILDAVAAFSDEE